MRAESQPSNGDDEAISSLDIAIVDLDRAGELSSITPAKAVPGSVSVLLKMIKDTMVDKPDYVELGLICAHTCSALNQGVNGRRLDELSGSVWAAIEQLETTVTEIQGGIRNQGQNSHSQPAHMENGIGTVDTWKTELNRILQVFKTELTPNTDIRVSNKHQNTLNGHDDAGCVNRADVPTLDRLQRLLQPDKSEFPGKLHFVIRIGESDEHIQGVQGDNLATTVESQDNAPDHPAPTDVAAKESLKALQGIFTTQMRQLLPHVLSAKQLSIGGGAFAFGGYSDVFKGTYDGLEVCIKRLGVDSADSPEEVAKGRIHYTLCREALIWKRLIHPNIVPFKGITFSPLQIVSEWMPGGDLTTYVNLKPGASRVGLLADVANGLHYLHLHGVIHGDLKGPNIMVDASGHARITDFGLAHNHDDEEGTYVALGGTERWTAPEILEEKGSLNKSADVFSFAMVMVEVFTSAAPFDKLTSIAATLAIMEDKRPPRPAHSALTDELWELMQHCWLREPCLRPEMSQVVQVLNSKPYDEEYKEWIQDLVGLVDCLDKTLNAVDPVSPAFRKCLHELGDICGARMILPISYTLSLQVLKVESRPLVPSGSVDVHKWTLDGSKVWVRRVRICSNKDNPTNPQKAFYRDAVAWKHLKHRNIVPLLGITSTPLKLVSEWMPGGVLTEYVRGNSAANRRGLLRDVAKGLEFLHSQDVIHGNLKGSNILVDVTGHAKITDFGLSTATQKLECIRSASEGHSHAARWTAPEVLAENGTLSEEADVFSFAMVMVEVYTGAVPFSDLELQAAIAAITGGERPLRPTHQSLTDDLWELMQSCWDRDPQSRPTVSEVLKTLRGLDPLPILQGHQVGDFDPTSADLRDVGKKPFRLNPPNMAAEDLSAWKFIKDAPDTNGGRTTNKTSHLQTGINFRGRGSTSTPLLGERGLLRRVGRKENAKGARETEKRVKGIEEAQKKAKEDEETVKKEGAAWQREKPKTKNGQGGLYEPASLRTLLQDEHRSKPRFKSPTRLFPELLDNRKYDPPNSYPSTIDNITMSRSEGQGRWD